MKHTGLIILILIAAAVRADCDADISGIWTLDYQHYLDSASGGDPGARDRLNDIWDGKTFLEMTLDSTDGSGSFAQRHENGWVSYGFRYQITADRGGDCTMTLSPDTGDRSSQPESYRFRETQDGFCLLPLANPRWEDCYIESRD